MTTLSVVLLLSAFEGAVLGFFTDPGTGETRMGLKEPDVRAAFAVFTPIMPTEASADELEQLIRHVLVAVSADISGPGSGPVVKNDHKPWLKDIKSDINWRRWRAYRRMLSKQGRSGRVLERLD